MKKNLLYISTLIASLTSCSDNGSMHEDNTMSDNVVSVEIEDFVYSDGTRADYKKLDDRYEFSWEKGDELGVFADKGGHQALFKVAQGEGSSTALIEGGDWTLRPNTDYVAYYPFYYDTPNKTITVDLEGKTSLNDCDYMYSSKQTTDAKGNVNFKMNHLTSLIDIDIWVPKFGTCDKITIESNGKKFVLNGSYNLGDTNPKVTPGKTSQSLIFDNTTELNNLHLSKSLNFMMFPIDLSSDDITVTVEGKEMGIETVKGAGQEEKPYTYTFTAYKNEKCESIPFKGNDFQAGKAYSYKVQPFEYVDLGLKDDKGNPVYWATCNIGATKPEEIGNYFQWGELTPKSTYLDYTKEKNKFYNSETQTYNKYYITEGSSTSGTNVDLKELLPVDDAAYKNWGEGWRMPSDYDFDQLKTNCSWEKVTLQNGAVVYKVSSKQVGNDNFIYLPVTGKIGNKNGLVIDNEEGWYLVRDFYFSNKKYSESDSRVYEIFKNQNATSVSIRKWNTSREDGVPIRPVYIGK